MSSSEVFISGIGRVDKTPTFYGRVQDLSRTESYGPLFTDVFHLENGLLSAPLIEGILKTGPILDLCCGDGYNLEKLAEIHTQTFPAEYEVSDQKYKLIGVDVDTAAARRLLAKKKQRFDVDVSFIQADVFDFFAGVAQEATLGVYKLITCTAIGEMINDMVGGIKVGRLTRRQDAFFQSVRNLLAPGGLFYFPEAKEFRHALEKNGFQSEPMSGDLFWSVK